MRRLTGLGQESDSGVMTEDDLETIDNLRSPWMSPNPLRQQGQAAGAGHLRTLELGARLEQPAQNPLCRDHPGIDEEGVEEVPGGDILGRGSHHPRKVFAPTADVSGAISRAPTTRSALIHNPFHFDRQCGSA